MARKTHAVIKEKSQWINSPQRRQVKRRKKNRTRNSFQHWHMTKLPKIESQQVTHYSTQMSCFLESRKFPVKFKNKIGLLARIGQTSSTGCQHYKNKCLTETRKSRRRLYLDDNSTYRPLTSLDKWDRKQTFKVVKWGGQHLGYKNMNNHDKAVMNVK